MEQFYLFNFYVQNYGKKLKQPSFPLFHFCFSRNSVYLLLFIRIGNITFARFYIYQNE